MDWSGPGRRLRLWRRCLGSRQNKYQPSERSLGSSAYGRKQLKTIKLTCISEVPLRAQTGHPNKNKQIKDTGIAAHEEEQMTRHQLEFKKCQVDGSKWTEMALPIWQTNHLQCLGSRQHRTSTLGKESWVTRLWIEKTATNKLNQHAFARCH